MAKFGRRGRRAVYVAELGREVRVRGLSLAELDELPAEDLPEAVPNVCDPRYPAALNFICEFISAGVVSPRLSREEVARLGVESRGRLLRAIHMAHPETRRLRAQLLGEHQQDQAAAKRGDDD